MLTYTNCTLCPRRCGADRSKGELGYCRQPGQIKAARAALHEWEEPVISAGRGSGAVFFSGCTLGCVYCQNEAISHEGVGREISSGRLRQMFEELIAQGAQNINLVTPTHFLPDILPALSPKLPVPVVYNCGGYESVETIRALEGLVDVFLPDFKYSNRTLAMKLSHAPDYAETAAAAILQMQQQVGPAMIKNGVMRSGVIVRHLILPGQIDNSLGVLDWFAENLKDKGALLSIMSQYVPMGKAAKMPGFDRTISREEYDAVLSYAEFLGIENGFTQELSAADDAYIPPFDGTGL